MKDLQKIIEAAWENRALLEDEATREAIRAVVEAAGIRDKVKVMIGGAPITQAFADEIGADGYSDNANSAVALAKRLMGV